MAGPYLYLCPFYSSNFFYPFCRVGR